jgi:hypothetical protein
MAMFVESAGSTDRFVVLRDGRTVTLSPDQKKAQQIARHFKRLQPAATVVVQDLSTENSEEI